MISALQPLWQTLFSGEADPPPPRSRRLRFPMPRGLGLLPFKNVDLVQLTDFVLAWVLYGTGISELVHWNDLAKAAGGPQPLPEVMLHLTAICFGLPVLLRDRRPLAAWRVAIVLIPVTFWVLVSLNPIQGSQPYHGGLIAMYLLVLYSVAVRCLRAITVTVWIITVLTAWIVQPNSMPIAAAGTAVAVLFGYNVRVRRSATAQLVQEERRTALAEAAQAVLAERARIARELHDVVAHHMSVIAIQAEAVPLKAAGDVGQLEAGLAEIRVLSLEAINELRQVLGVLRDADGRKETTPQPGLERLDELVANARGAGLAVLVKGSGSTDGLPAAVGLSLYRIVQESLSNAMRHAPGAAVAVEITRETHTVRLRVANSAGTKKGAAPGAGQGLVGMRERAALLGGTLEAAPVDGGGFEVSAVLPIGEGEDTA